MCHIKTFYWVYEMTNCGTHRASLMAVHSEVRAEEQVSDGQEQ